MIICVEMDFSADPLWIGEEYEGSIAYANDSLEKYQLILSQDLLHSLELLRSTWEKFHDSKYRSLFDDSEFPGKFLMRETLNSLMFICASQIKKEQPQWRVFYANMNDYKRKELK